MTLRQRLALRRLARTTEDRLWSFVAEQAKILQEVGNDEDTDNERKKQLAEGPFAKIKQALRQLGVIR